MKKKIIIIVSIFLVLAVVAVSTIGCICRANRNLSKEGDGETFSFTNIDLLSSKASYEYDKENSSYWDYFFMEYDITTFFCEYNEYVYQSPKYQTHRELTNVYTEKISGYMSHENGTYYLKENYGSESCEFLIDTLTNNLALRITGNNIISYFTSDTNGWINCDANQNDIKYVLELCNHFYDIEFLKYFHKDINNFSQTKDNIYTVNSEKAVSENAFARWFEAFDANGRQIYFSNDIQSCSVEIDLNNPQAPILNFSLTTLFPAIDRSITCGGKIKYNYVNNTVIEIPQTVKDMWQLSNC